MFSYTKRSISDTQGAWTGCPRMQMAFNYGQEPNIHCFVAKRALSWVTYIQRLSILLVFVYLYSIEVECQCAYLSAKYLSNSRLNRQSANSFNQVSTDPSQNISLQIFSLWLFLKNCNTLLQKRGGEFIQFWGTGFPMPERKSARWQRFRFWKWIWNRWIICQVYCFGCVLNYLKIGQNYWMDSGG